MHRGLWPSSRGKVSLSLSPRFESQRARLSPSRCLTCLLGLQGIQWIQGLVVVHVSWPEHPKLPKKKKPFQWVIQSQSFLIGSLYRYIYYLYFLSKFLENGTVLFHYLSTEEPNCESLKILDSVDKTLYLEIKLRNELFVRDRIKDL